MAWDTYKFWTASWLETHTNSELHHGLRHIQVLDCIMAWDTYKFLTASWLETHTSSELHHDLRHIQLLKCITAWDTHICSKLHHGFRHIQVLDCIIAWDTCMFWTASWHETHTKSDLLPDIRQMQVLNCIVSWGLIWDTCTISTATRQTYASSELLPSLKLTWNWNKHTLKLTNIGSELVQT